MTFDPGADGRVRLPLGSLDAVVFDTETTGLDPKSARIIEIGAVRLRSGQIDANDSFSVLLNPGIPIPASSTGIHGISDSDVTNAPGFPSAVSAFTEWAGPSPVLGFSIGYDLAVLEAECARHDMVWSAPISIDVQTLVKILGVDLPDLSLETIAARYGIAIEGRHRSVPDALLTARVFTALVPELRAHGIRTFAETERACRSLERRQGDVVGLQSNRTGASRGRVSLDSFLYRHRIGDLMRSPPIVLPAGARLTEAVSLMAENGVGSVIIAPGSGDDPAPGPGPVEVGGLKILTERDVLRAIHESGGQALEKPVDALSPCPLITVAIKEFAYRAMSLMSAKGVRHVGVVGDGGRLAGILSARDSLTHQADDGIILGREIDESVSAGDLGRVWSGLTTVVGALSEEGVDPRRISAIISRELRALTGRATALAEAEAATAAEIDSPPARYTMMVLGSGGRGESLLAMDQDNAIIFDDRETGGTVDRWCESLGCRVADILDEVGVRYCDGGVMARNPEWRMNRQEWRRQTRDWIARTRPQDLMNADIFFDAMGVHGDLDLAESLRIDAMGMARQAKPFLRRLASNAAEIPSPFGWLGRLKLDRGRVDLKKAGLLPVFSAARVVALEFGIRSRSTAERLRAFGECGVVPGPLINDLVAAHGILLGAILRQQLSDLQVGLPLSNSVAVNELEGHDRQQLIWALERVPSVIDVMRVPATI
ncbi:MAG: DUF294 nucleotidyltransferase-like domain-containing protein [Paracoccaceae bacterium]|nr:DUF294 nucleotidyltransferase-like domain-containing protein [Paracoccaceae bacterium]